MAKFIIFLLALTLASKISGAAACTNDDGDLQQRQETMAEFYRVFSNPVTRAAADTETVIRTASFLKREMGPLVPIFKAIRGMPESTAAEAGARDEAFDAAQELLRRHFRQLLVPHGSAAKTAYDEDLARQEAMAQVVRFAYPSWRHPRPTDAATIHRLATFLKLEMGPIETIFHAIRGMPESSAVKDEAFDAAMELLGRHLRLLLPHGCPSCGVTDDAGFAVSNMTESSAAEVLSKEEAHAAAKEMLNRHLDQLLAGRSDKCDDDH